MLSELREKAMMDEQSRLNGARREGLERGLKEIILDNLSEIGNVPKKLIELINKQNNMEILKSWNKLAVISENLDEFQEKIK